MSLSVSLVLVILPFSLYVGRPLLVYTTDHDDDGLECIYSRRARQVLHMAVRIHMSYGVRYRMENAVPTPNFGMGLYISSRQRAEGGNATSVSTSVTVQYGQSEVMATTKDYPSTTYQGRTEQNRDRDMDKTEHDKAEGAG